MPTRPHLPPADAIIQLVGVTKRFSASGRDVLSDVDLAVPKGEIFGIIGRSGAGKSTLVRLINGLERPSEGRVLVKGIDVGGLDGAGLRALRRRVGMIFQAFGLLSSATAAQNVAFPLKVAGASRAEIKARVAELLALVGLSDHAAKYPAQLSGGQKQRVGIARALASRPEILLCDEATSALDPETTREVLALIAALNRDLGLTIVLITHEMDVVRQICDRVTVLKAGRVVESGLTADVVLAPQSDETRALLADAGESTAELGRDFPGQVVRFTMRDKAVAEPVISRVARDTGTDISILDGRIGRLRDEAYGQLTLGLRGGDVDAALALLARYGDLDRGSDAQVAA